MPWERDLLSINPNPGSLIKPFNTVPEYVDTRLQHFLIILNSRHIFPFNWHSEMPLQFYQIGTKFSRDIATHFWILIHLIEIVIMKLFWNVGKDSHPTFSVTPTMLKSSAFGPLWICTFLCRHLAPFRGAHFFTVTLSIARPIWLTTNSGLAWDHATWIT